MPRRPLFKILWDTMFGDNAWLIMTAVIGGFSIYMLFKKKDTPPDERRKQILSNTKTGDPLFITRLNQHQFKDSKVCLTWEVLNEGAGFEYCGKKFLDQCAFNMDVYLMCRIESQEEKNEIIRMLRSMKISRHKVLFCETAKGYDAFCRQIKPALLVTHDKAQAVRLKSFIAHVVYVGGYPLEGAVTTFSTLSSLYSVLFF
ncbi:hypothetical protein DQ04_01411140 [Trypanosoma grayi]|uniref:hypothetical protein n=1 Tax=Trypanosoma grayi TaxID=71804 RepID=UPI0004F41308|nr:hypothetical protein DQ04_01411140 [Trypanosoma grayi]KEG12812.1 hypothetical protein DQ04_01411140 [Trypanosoma grayi]